MKEPSIEVCFSVYQRYHRLPEILKQLKAQTIQNFKVNIWNNSDEELDVGSFWLEGRIQLINSKENAGSKSRFILAKQTTGNPIIFFDDDEELSPDFVEYNYNQYLKFGPKCILGWFTRTFTREGYWQSVSAKYGQEVDFMGLGGMILDREIIDKEPLLQNIPPLFSRTEDLYLCYLARMKYGMKLIRIEPRCKILIDGKDQYLNIDKESIFRELRKLGWRLLKDGTGNPRKFSFRVRKGQQDGRILSGELNLKCYQIPKNPKVVVDIGAHIGGTSMVVAKLGATVYAYEPEEENFKLLKENIALNNLEDKIHCFQKGVGIPGKRKLYLDYRNSGNATLESSNNPTQEVEIITIQDVFKNIPHCDLLKIDCEGAEYEFIKDVPFEKVNQISMELHAGKQKEIIEYLSQFYGVVQKTALDKTSLMVFCYKKGKTTSESKLCPICGFNGGFFELTEEDKWHPHEELRCPWCYSAGRHRMTWLVYKEMKKTSLLAGKMLHCSPMKCLKEKFIKDFICTSIDFPPRESESGMAMADFNQDLRDTLFRDDYFDVVVCVAVLDDIKETERAIKEIYRITKPGGVAFITVPIFKDKKSERLERPEWKSWWFCGLDFFQKYTDSGFEVKIIKSTQIEGHERYGLTGDYLALCHKPSGKEKK